MPNSTPRTVTQWLLLCALFVGVVGMHHVMVSDIAQSAHRAMSASAHHPQAPQEPSPTPTPTHDTLHLCVAVLCAMVSLLLMTWLLVRATNSVADRLRSTFTRARVPDHPPPIGGRGLLSSLCVLRL